MNKTTPVDQIGQGADEETMVREMFGVIEELRSTNPDYYAYFEDVDPDTAPRADLVQLMHAAPNDAVKFFLFGKFMMRMAISQITGREFS